LYRYAAYGLVLAADQPIPWLVESRSSQPPDIKVYQKDKPDWLAEVAGEPMEPWDPSKSADSARDFGWRVSRSGRFVEVRYSDGTIFIIDNIKGRIWADWDSKFAVTDMALYLLGPILGFVLAVRGMTVLHAAVISIGSTAFALIGPSGAGKSTAAAAFALRGHAVLTEDIAVVSARDDAFFVEAGYPTIRLWPPSVVSLLGDEDALPLLSPGWEKRDFDLQGRGAFPDEAKRLTSVYVIGERSTGPATPRVEPMSEADGLIALLSNTFINLQPRIRARAREFLILSQVANTLPVRRLVPHEDPGMISEQCRIVEEDFLDLSKGDRMAD
jgi:hypothetical protein